MAFATLTKHRTARCPSALLVLHGMGALCPFGRVRNLPRIRSLHPSLTLRAETLSLPLPDCSHHQCFARSALMPPLHIVVRASGLANPGLRHTRPLCITVEPRTEHCALPLCPSPLRLPTTSHADVPRPQQYAAGSRNPPPSPYRSLLPGDTLVATTPTEAAHTAHPAHAAPPLLVALRSAPALSTLTPRLHSDAKGRASCSTPAPRPYTEYHAWMPRAQPLAQGLRVPYPPLRFCLRARYAPLMRCPGIVLWYMRGSACDEAPRSLATCLPSTPQHTAARNDVKPALSNYSLAHACRCEHPIGSMQHPINPSCARLSPGQRTHTRYTRARANDPLARTCRSERASLVSQRGSAPSATLLLGMPHSAFRLVR
jgi:hypothetical protein